MITRDTIETIVKNNVPATAYVEVTERVWPIDKKPYIRIAIAANDHQIHNVHRQFPQLVQLAFYPESGLLRVANFDGMGERSVWLKPNKEDPKEKYLAMVSKRISFRTPKPNEAAISKAIGNFAKRWTQELKDNRDRLKYQDIVDYDTLLSE